VLIFSDSSTEAAGVLIPLIPIASESRTDLPNHTTEDHGLNNPILYVKTTLN